MENLRNKLINMLNNNQLDLNVFADYYFNNCSKKKCLTQEEFQAYFPTYWQYKQNEIIDYLKREYSIVSVISKQNQVIKYL